MIDPWLITAGPFIGLGYLLFLSGLICVSYWLIFTGIAERRWWKILASLPCAACVGAAVVGLMV